MTSGEPRGSVLAAHADWSIAPAKRWITRAWRRGGTWRVAPPVPVGDPASLLARLQAEAAGAPVAFGGDFALGLPRAYAKRAGIDDFPAWLRALPPDAPLFAVCDRLDEVSLARPFYPRASVKGAGQMERQALALGLAGRDDLRRVVDRMPLDAVNGVRRRSGGAPLFWTMGANQCGKGALSAWRDCLMPAFGAGVRLAIWPFEGEFRALLAPDRIVVAETYPAESLVQLGLRMRGSKRRQADRAAQAPAIEAVMAARGIVPEPALAAMMASGFDVHADGEDRFDSVLGVLNVIAVVDGAPDGVPDDPVIRAVEGWVLGQADPMLVPPWRA